MSKANRKATLLIESGIRIHTTNFMKNKKDIPSGFSMKVNLLIFLKVLVKKTFKNLDMTFGKGEHSYHILVEFYSSVSFVFK
jgi:predicted ribosome quality control (RQC) complex YloA/Tae2 family protein